MAKRRGRGKIINSALALLYFLSLPGRPAWAAAEEIFPSEQVQGAAPIDVSRTDPLPDLIAPLNPGIALGDFSNLAVSAGSEYPTGALEAQTPAFISSSARRLPMPLIQTASVLESAPETQSAAPEPAEPEPAALEENSAPDRVLGIFPNARAKTRHAALLARLSAVYADIAKASGVDSLESLDQKADFADFYSGFLEDLNAKFLSEYGADRSRFQRDVEQNSFHAAKSNVGEMETKLIEGRVCIRFIPKGPKPLAVVLANAPLAVNEGIVLLPVRPHVPEKNPPLDPALGSPKLDVYRSRLLINRKIRFSSLLFHGSPGDPHRGVLVIDEQDGASFFSPALKVGDRRWWRHWAKGTFEPARYGDWVRGITSSSIQFGLACAMAFASRLVHSSAHSLIWGPAAAAGVFSLALATFSDSYAALVQRGDNKIWESMKRLFIGALLAYPLSVMQAHGDWGVLFTLKTNALVWLVGFGDRHLSTVMNVIPKIHQRYYMKPWFFPVRVNTPFRNAAARLFGRQSLRYSTIKGITLTREALAIPRFVLKFLGLFLDPALMAYTKGVPVATIILWLSAVPFEIYNHRALKRLAAGNPVIRKELDALKKQR